MDAGDIGSRIDTGDSIDSSASLDTGTLADVAEDDTTTPSFDAELDETGADAASEVAADTAVDATTRETTAPKTGTCYVGDTTVAQPTVPCDPGLYCITGPGGQPQCVASDDHPDANVESCGLINCAYDQFCYCANTATSYCVCDFLVGGPLAPPDLPAS